MKVSTHISWQAYDTRIYVVDERTDAFFTFENVSVEIFQFVTQGRNQDEIVSCLFDKYGSQVSFDVIENDVRDFIDIMKEKELIQG